MSYGYSNYGGNGYNGYGNGYGNDPDDIGLDLSGVREWRDFELLPPGEYRVAIVGAERKFSNDYTYLSLTFSVVEGQFMGRKLFESFFLWSERNEVARQRFKALRSAIGLNPNIGGRVSELPDKEFVAHIKVRNRWDSKNRCRSDEKENYIAEFLPLTGNSQGGARIASQAPSAPAPSENMQVSDYAKDMQGTPPAQEAPFPTPGDNTPF